MPEKDSLFLHLRDLPYFRALVRTVESAFYQDLDLPSPTLDVGCGDGHFASLTFGHKLDVGLDPWRAPLHEARKRNAYHLLVEADGGKIPFPDGTFASAISNSVLEHILNIEPVLIEIARTLKTGAPFIFSMPNERYLSELDIPRRLRSLGLMGLADKYTDWFRRISRVAHADDPEVWEKRLVKANFSLDRCWHYFSPSAVRVLEWGHYLGLPSLVARVLTGRWILAPYRWNLFITEALVRRYTRVETDEQGTFTFYIAYKR